LLSGGGAVVLTIATLVFGQTASAAGPAPVGLGTAAPFAVLAGTPAVTNTGPSTITGDLGISPAASVTGFPPGTVSGAIHAADAVALQAKSDLATAYTDAATRPMTATHGTLGGLTLVSGVYNAGGVVLDLTGTLTLDGQNDPDSVWVFQATSSLVTASSSTVRLINGARSCNVFWQITSSATLGSGSTFVGTILALTSITMGSGVTVDGRALARNGDVTLISDTITRSTCSTSPTPTPSPTPGASATSSPSPSASATVSPTASATASPAPTPSQMPTRTPTVGPSLPPTSSPPTSSDGSGPGSGPVVLLGVFVLAFVIAARRSVWALRSR
jgi:type VI secretion system secreted protein VgrG